MLVAALTWQVAGHGPLYRWDTSADAAVLRLAAGRRAVAPVAQFWADAGNVTVVLPVLALAVGYGAWRRRRRGGARWWGPAVAQAVAMACALPLVVGLKALVARPAPGATRLVAHSGYFPSGHAVTAAVGYGLCVLALAPGTAAARRCLAGAAVLLNVAVGAALVWRGYHWPLDVAAGWALAAIVLEVTRRVVRSWWGSPG
nr:phosphatase PAP2 family protein [Streptomyces sp. SID5468]